MALLCPVNFKTNDTQTKCVPANERGCYEMWDTYIQHAQGNPSQVAMFQGFRDACVAQFAAPPARAPARSRGRLKWPHLKGLGNMDMASGPGRTYRDGVLGSMAMASGPGRTFQDGVLGGCATCGIGNLNDRAYQSGVLGDYLGARKDGVLGTLDMSNPVTWLIGGGAVLLLGALVLSSSGGHRKNRRRGYRRNQRRARRR